MTLKEIALKNLMRRKGKAAFILAGLVIGVATVVTIISFIDGMTSDINRKLEKYGANILIVPRTDNLALTYGGLSLGGVSFEMKEIQQSELAAIDSIKNAGNVAAVGPIVLGAIQVKDKRVLLAGIDFKSTVFLKPWWKIRGRSPDKQSFLLGSDRERILRLKKGETLTVNNRELKVTGVLEPTGSQDDQLVFTSIETAQAVLNKAGRVSMVEVAALCKDCPIDDMVAQISGVLPNAKVMAIQQVVKGRMETLAQFKKFSYGISAVIVLIGGLVVLVTLMSSVRERTGEIGIFRALGFRKGHVMQIIFLEAGIISGLAGILGYLLGIVGAYAGLSLFSESAAPAIPFDLHMVIAAIVLAVSVGLIASAYPALMAARLDPNEALRSL